MSDISFRQLDQRLQETHTSTLIMYNQMGEQQQMEQRTRTNNITMLISSVVMIVIGTTFDFNGMPSDYIQIALSGISLMVMIWAYFQDSQRAMLSMASISTAFALYNLVGAPFIEGRIDTSNIVIGALQVIATLFYIRQANTYQKLKNSIKADIDQTLYDAVRHALQTQRPNNSNQLLELQELTQTITVWLRPDGVVMLLQREQRLYFDVHHSFKLVADGNDKGGDKLTVRASIINQTRRCLISRHGWLRYTRFMT
ncbi:MAG: hypothetical protein AAF846_06090 [Chloroflexota bacterium]